MATFRFRAKGQCKQNIPAAGERIDASFLAKLVGVSRQHITHLCRKGSIPGSYQSKGGHWRFRWSRELKDWASGEIRQTSPVFPESAYAKRAETLVDEMLSVREIANFARLRERALYKQLQRCGERAMRLAMAKHSSRMILSIQTSIEKPATIETAQSPKI